VTNVVPKSPSEAMYVEAAAWVVQLHGPNRSPAIEAGLRRWLAEAPAHQAAFEFATETWNSTSAIKCVEPGQFRKWMQTRPGAGITLAAAAGAAAVAIGLGVVSWLHGPQMQTQVGEQRTLRLEDGTQVSLNTNTRLFVRYDERARRITLEQGEALFDVASQPGRPFVVTAGGRKIEALGTAFVVRNEARLLAVTLVEGKVAVSTSSPHDFQGSRSGSNIVLAAGERVVFAESELAKRDQPNLEKLTAWQRGLVMLDETPLGEAIAEMNRYSTVKLAIEERQIAALKVSGMFRAGDSRRFARAVAKTYRLVVVEQPQRIVLAGAEVN
jgi:transmembrane sensor